MYRRSRFPSFLPLSWKPSLVLMRSTLSPACLIQIARDGKITDDEIKDFAYISQKLDEVSLAIDSLNLWVDKTASEKNINIELLNAEKAKLEHK